MAVVISERLLDGSDRLLDAEADEQLVTLVRAGHEAAFAAIVRRYERELKTQAGRLTSDGRAEDAVQQAFLNAFAALRRGSEVRHLRGWLHHILRNEVTRARVPLEAPLDAIAIYGEALEDTVQLRATAHDTLVHLSDLPERQRDALLGTAVLGFPRAHVARTMGLSEGAVRQLVHRARLRLRQASSAFIPFPLVKLFGAVRSGVDAAPDAALGAGTTASGGLAIKFGALLASGVVATGIAVTHTFPPRHHPALVFRGGRHHTAPSRAVPRGASAAPLVSPGDAAALSNAARLREHGPAGAGTEDRSHGGPGRLSGTRSGRGEGPGRGDDRGRGQGGSGRTQTGTSGRDGDRSGSASGTSTGSRSGSGSGDDGGGSGSGRSGSGSGSGDRGAPRSGSTTASGGTGSDDGAGSRDGARGSGGGGGSVSSSDGAPSGGSVQGASGSVTTPAATATTDTSSGGGGGSDGGTSGGSLSGGTTSGSGSSGGGSSDGGTESSGGSRDLSGSLDSSSS